MQLDAEERVTLNIVVFRDARSPHRPIGIRHFRIHSTRITCSDTKHSSPFAKHASIREQRRPVNITGRLVTEGVTATTIVSQLLAGGHK